MTAYEQLVKALRFEADYIAVEKTMCDAADAIEELQAEVKRLELDNEDYEYTLRERYDEPKQRKLGRWEKAKPKGVVTYSDGYAECSSCHEVIWLGWGMNFCPHCGTQNKIIDPDDMAKTGGTDASRPD